MVVRKPRSVINVYDPNLNPYGYELASGLAAVGRRVRWWTDGESNRQGVPGLRCVQGLAGGRCTGSAPKLLLARLVGPLRFCFSAGRGPALICWVRDPWDALVFGLRARFNLPTVVVYHNPRQLRPREGLAGRLEQWLLARARVVVHSEWLRDVAAKDFPNATVAPHPLYVRTVAAAGGAPTDEVLDRVFALVGGLRADKGVDNLLPLARATTRPWTLRVIGPDALPTGLEAELAENSVGVEYPESAPPSDTELVQLLGSSTAMIAPYTAPTTSGTAYMALTLGVPVIALESPSFSDIVPMENRAPKIPDMARIMDAFETGSSRVAATDDHWPGLESWLEVVDA